MSPQDARRLADALDKAAKGEEFFGFDDGLRDDPDPLLTEAAAMLRAQAEQIERLQGEGAAARDRLLHDLDRVTAEVGRLNALAGPGGKSLGELERVNDDFIKENERLTAERDSLRAALQRIVDWDDAGMALTEDHIAQARATLAAKDPT